MNKEEIKIITLGDIFRNLETEEQAFEFLKYIKNLQQENQELKKQLKKNNKPQIFIDTQDMEERYAEGLYQDYLEEENKKYKEVIDKAIEYINNNWDGCSYTDETLKNKVSELNITELLDILKEV